MKRSFGFACVFSLFCVGGLFAQTARLTLNADKVIHTVDDRIYGQFLEHIYHSINGGLWGEVVWNRSFEEAQPQAGGRGNRGGATQPAAQEALSENTVARHWMMLGSPRIMFDTDRPLNSVQSLKIETAQNSGGITQHHLWIKQGDVQCGSLWLRGDAPNGVRVELLDGKILLAEQELSAPTEDWKEYPLALNPAHNCLDATLRIVASAKSSFWIDQVSLMPDSYKATGGFRPDLLEAVAGLKPSTIRWPGGSFVHTSGGYRWKGGVGPQSKRIGKVGWDELEPFAFGTDEFIALCRKLGSEPVIVVYLGNQAPGTDRAAFAQEAADWVEYCNGPATSKWGAMRAANGHPEPYHVKYWEIDNEVWNMDAQDYVSTVKQFTTAMKQIDPIITTIACGSGGYGSRFGAGDTRAATEGIKSRDADAAIIADASDVADFLSPHHYENIENYAKGIDLAEAYFSKMGQLIEKSKNPNFKLFFSEWNVRRGIDWRAGLYAGGILNFMERNKYIAMACPALWLRHSSTGETWDNAFINFDHKSWFPAPNYVVMKLFRDHFAPNQIEATGEAAGLNIIATKSADGRQIFVKVVNPTESAVPVTLTMKGGQARSGAALKLVAPDQLEARNSFEKTDAIKVIDGKINRDGNDVTFSMPRWSVGVVEIAN